MNLVDIGANLTHESFDEDREQVIEHARDSGVQRMIVTGSSADSSRQAVQLAESRPGVLYATAGVHPHHAEEYVPQVSDLLLQLADHECVVAIGECGLDYFRDFSPRPVQCEAFESQLEVAVVTQLPLFLHQRDAHAEFSAILRPFMARIKGGVAHCFTGDAAALHDYLEMGLYIGITGWICDERRGAELKAMARQIPLDRLLIETDAPYLMPRSLVPKPRGRRNEPKYLREVLRVLAQASGYKVEHIAVATTENAERLFSL